MNQNIRNEIISNNKSFWLYWDSDILIDRIKNGKNRPLGKKLDERKLLNLIMERSKLYIKADHKINCNKLTKPEIVNKIIKLII